MTRSTLCACCKTQMIDGGKDWTWVCPTCVCHDLETDAILHDDEVIVKIAEIEVVISRIKNEYYYIDDEGEECGCFEIVKMLEDLK